MPRSASRKPWAPKVVAFCGPAGAGKSTAAEFLVKDLGYTPLRITSRLEAMAALAGVGPDYLNPTRKDKPFPEYHPFYREYSEHPRTPRDFVNELGTFLRGYDPKFMLRAWKEDFRALTDPEYFLNRTPRTPGLLLLEPQCRMIVVDNIRMVAGSTAEYDLMREVGAHIIRIDRDPEQLNFAGMPFDNPALEIYEQQNFPADDIVRNDGTVSTLEQRVEASLYVAGFI